MTAPSAIADLLQRQEREILTDWLKEQAGAVGVRGQAFTDADLRAQSKAFLAVLLDASRKGGVESVAGEAWLPVKENLRELSRTRAEAGFSTSETAIFIFSLKKPLFARLRTEFKDDSNGLADALWQTSLMLDQLGLYTVEAYVQSREGVISRQQGELMELSTPVVELWQDIVALPLVGTLDSQRTQVVMETLLEKIVATGASIAIIDITGVPTVDTLVAQHLLKTVAATRLMGADCIISGIRPQIAQTIVHLGVNLGEVTTKATLADAFKVALQRTGSTIDAKSKSDAR